MLWKLRQRQQQQSVQVSDPEALSWLETEAGQDWLNQHCKPLMHYEWASVKEDRTHPINFSSDQWDWWSAGQVQAIRWTWFGYDADAVSEIRIEEDIPLSREGCLHP